MSNLEDVLNKVVWRKTYHRRESVGPSPSQWEIFSSFLVKKAILMSLDHISLVFSAIWKN